MNLAHARGFGRLCVMKTNKLITAVLCAAAALIFWYLGKPPAQQHAVPLTESGEHVTHEMSPRPLVDRLPQTNDSIRRAVSSPEANISGPSIARNAALSPDESRAVGMVPSARLPEEQAINALHVTVRNFGLRFRGNPVGNNAEITAALNGDNPGGVHFLDPSSTRLNDKGELIDEWGTPYFFHQLSGTDMEIHSAGPDRIMGNSDDLVVH